ncbi:MAG: type II toxin-antitoxin system VapC family toxin [Bifidobacteriaceae bacterium]|jgi:predicted nucleic acid-binding protein|nr:type II toxin-antitoxin system VapC family toxin [Bifidobacteriaceae bacterium]
MIGLSVVLDANVLIAATEPNDPHHRRAVEAMTAAAPGTMAVHPLTLAEVLVGGVRQGRGPELKTAIEAAGVVILSGDVVDPLVIAAVRHDTGLKLPDAVVLATAQALGVDLLTFDLALRARAAFSTPSPLAGGTASKRRLD